MLPGSSKAVNAVCLAVFDPSTNSALSRQLESAKEKCNVGGFRPVCLRYGIQPMRSALDLVAP
jgi:hypothetical protein